MKLALVPCWVVLGTTLGIASVPIVPVHASATPEPQALILQARNRVPDGTHDAPYRMVQKPLQWDSSKTAVIIVDMWDKHWCQGASSRVAELAPRLNRFVAAARDKGVLIVHAPSSCMEPYKDHPARHRAQNAPKAGHLPPEIAGWCKQIPAEEKGKYPIDQSDGGCDCTPKCQG